MISDPILTTMTLLYLASLSGCMFFGVLMLESGSPRFDIAVCLFTVVVIFLSHAIILGGDPSVSSDRLHFKDYADLPQWLQVHQVKNARRQRSRTSVQPRVRRVPLPSLLSVPLCWRCCASRGLPLSRARERRPEKRRWRMPERTPL